MAKKLPNLIHSFAPLMLEKRAGRMTGIITSRRPASRGGYASRDSARGPRRIASPPNAPPIASRLHKSGRPPVPPNTGMPLLPWDLTAAMSRRRRKTTPNPLSKATAGSSTGSAYGASQRITRCATRKSAPRANTGPRKPAVTRPARPASDAAAYAPTSTIAKTSNPSSALRRLPDRDGRAKVPVSPMGGGAGMAGAVTTVDSPRLIGSALATADRGQWGLGGVDARAGGGRDRPGRLGP